jgi:putative phosphoesterase
MPIGYSVGKPASFAEGSVMRVLLCSDVHGNFDALAAVLGEQANYVLCAGDLVHFGPHPAECIDLIRGHATVVVQGNHDHGAGFGGDCRAYGPWRTLDEDSRGVTDMGLSVADRQYLRTLPFTKTITLGDARFAIVHAAPTDPLYRYLPPDTPAGVWRTELSLITADVLVLGHTHLPLLHHDVGPLVVNPGSVGLPRDGDHRAEYAIWENGSVTLHRRAYDLGPLLQAITTLSLPPAAIEDLVALFEGRGLTTRPPESD